MVVLALTLFNALHIQSITSISMNCQIARTREANRNTTARYYKQYYIHPAHLIVVLSLLFPSIFSLDSVTNLSCICSISIQYSTHLQN